MNLLFIYQNTKTLTKQSKEIKIKTYMFNALEYACDHRLNKSLVKCLNHDFNYKLLYLAKILQ